MQVWYHREADGKQVWEKGSLAGVFPRLTGTKGHISLDDWLWDFARKTEEDRYLVFTKQEEKALERLSRPFTAGGSLYFLELLCADSVKYRATRANKIVVFGPVYVDQPGKIGQQCETRLAMWVRLHADMTQHPRY